MSSSPIFFQFDSKDTAALAQDTLAELGYKAGRHSETGKPMLHVIVDRGDLTSALEIAQSFGGKLLEREGALDASRTFDMAYDMEGMIPIPAHLVNEDWDETYVDVSASTFVNKSSGAYNDEGEFDPSGDDYDHFDAGVHM